MSKPFRISLGSAKTFKSEEQITFTFAITNTSKEDLWILTWYTPLEGIYSDCLEVKREGLPVPYDGPLVKRGQPTASSYLKIRAGETIEKNFDLSRTYQVSNPGIYEAKLHPVVLYWLNKSNLSKLGKTDDGQNKLIIESKPRRFKVIEGGKRRSTIGEVMRFLDSEKETPQSPTKKTPKSPKKFLALPNPIFNGGTTAQKTATSKAHVDGYGLVVESIKSLKNDAHYTEWFGTHTAGRFNIVRNTYEKIKAAMEGNVFTYDLTGVGCKPDWHAYTYHNSKTIWYVQWLLECLPNRHRFQSRYRAP